MLELIVETSGRDGVSRDQLRCPNNIKNGEKDLVNTVPLQNACLALV